MSVSHTEQAVRDRTKTVTRRLGWAFLRPGDTLTLCRKVMGRKAGEPLLRLAEVEVVDVRRVPLYDIDLEDVEAEGVPPATYNGGDLHVAGCDDCAPVAWYEWFARTMRVPITAEVTRIEWRYLSGGE
jgi:hypothetical protein